MVKKAQKRKGKSTLADDLRAGLEEALKYARGEKTDVIVHTVVPSAAKARKARLTLGLSEPKKARRCH